MTVTDLAARVEELERKNAELQELLTTLVGEQRHFERILLQACQVEYADSCEQPYRHQEAVMKLREELKGLFEYRKLTKAWPRQLPITTGGTNG